MQADAEFVIQTVTNADEIREYLIDPTCGS